MSDLQPAVSICIANYNGETLLADCLDSIFAQQFAFVIEVIVHDDASSDASVALLQTHYPTVIVIESKKNVGFCISNNRMAAIAKGQYILLLNNDAALLPDALHHLFEHANNLPTPTLLSLPQYDWMTGALVDYGCLLDPFYNPVPNLDPTQRNVAMVIGACMWIPRTLWIELEGFPDWFESIAEDMYLCCHARLLGFPVQCLSVSGYRHHQGKSFGGNKTSGNRLTTTYRRRQLSERNKSYVLLICSPPLRLFFILPLHLILLALEGMTLSILKRDTSIIRKIYLSVYISLYTNLSKILDVRAALQGQRASVRVYHSVFTLWPRKLKLLFRHGIPHIR